MKWNSLKLEVENEYWTRSGQVVTIAGAISYPEYRLGISYPKYRLIGDNGITYTENGSAYPETAKNPNDLIAERRRI